MRRVPETLVALGVVACGSDLPLEDRPCPCADGYTCCELTNLCVGNGASCELTLSPGSVRLRLGATQPFTATLAVTWSVDEPYGGTIDQRGEYVAPLRPGTYHVRAHTRSGASQSVEVIVGPSELVHFLGAQGGIGNADGVGREARFKAPSSIVGDDQYLYVTDGRDAWSAYAGMGYPYPDTLGSKCVQRCAAATDPDACVEQQLGEWQPVLSPAGVRRISRATAEVTWLFRDTPVGTLALDGGTLYASKNHTTFSFMPGDGVTAQDECAFRAAPEAPPTIVGFDLARGVFSAVAGDDTPGPPQDGVGAGARFKSLNGMVARAGKLYAADAQALREVDIGTGKVTTLAAGPEWQGASLAQAPFGGLVAVALDGDFLYALEYPGTAIWQYDLKTGSVVDIPYEINAHAICFDSGDLQPMRRVALLADNCLHTDAVDSKCDLGTSEPGSDDGVSSARFNSPGGLWCAGDETYYVADTHNATIRKAKAYPDYSVVTVAGETAHVGPETALAPGPSMRLYHPHGITTDSSAYVAISMGDHDQRLVWRDPGAGFSTYSLSNPVLRPRPALGPAGTLSVPTGNGVFHLDLSKAFDQHLEEQAAGTFVSAPAYFDQLVYDGSGAFYASTAPCGIARIDASTGAFEIFFQDTVCGPLAVDDTRQLFAGAGPIFRIDIATRQATEMPAPVEGWHASGLAYDPAGVLYVAEAERQRVRGLNVETGEIFDVVGQLGSRGVQLRALPASLSRPADIALLPDGALLIADYDENVVLVAR